ncbi:MAG: hypothetical protein ABFD81_01610 [Syntrophaceae bacterium]
MNRIQHIPAVLLALILMIAGAPNALEAADISTWTKDEIKALPDSYWSTLKRDENDWTRYCQASAKSFSQIYGNAIHNSYDLFLKEQAGAPAKSPQVIQGKTLKRLTDVVYIPGKSFRTLSGTPLARLRLVAFKEGGLRMIPFDILEFTNQGRVVLPSGPEANAKDGDRTLSDNDRLFFLAVDAGDKVDKRTISEHFAGIKDIQEIELSYKPEGEKGWIYLAAFNDDSAEKSSQDYIVFRPESSMIQTPFMLIQTKARKLKQSVVPTLDVCTWGISPAIGGTAQDFHNRFNINMILSYRGGITKSETQDDIDLHMRAWYDGAVINFIRVTWKVATPLGIGAPTAFADVVASPFALYDQNFLSTPFDPSIIIKNFTLTLGEDMNARVLNATKPYRILTERDRKGLIIDGKSTTTKVLLDNSVKTHDLWNVLTGPAGSMCMISGMNDFCAQNAKFRLEWSDTPSQIGYYRYSLGINNFKNRQEHMYLEWNVVPFFITNSGYAWNNLDLVLKHNDKPLSYAVENSDLIRLGRFTHIPDVKSEKSCYRY